MKITIVTGNKLKQDMYSDFFRKHNIEYKFEDFNLTEIQAENPETISSCKAKEAYSKIKSPVVVDDIGFYILKYHSFPGIYTKHTFQGLGISNFLHLFDEGDSAKIVCSLVYKDKSIEKNFTGEISGILTKKEREIDSKNPISSLFIPNGYTITLKHLNEIENHRTKAINKLVEYLKNETNNL